MSPDGFSICGRSDHPSILAVEPLFAVARDAVGRRAGTAADDLLQLGADVVQRDAVVGRDAVGEPAVDELAVARPAALLSVVVRARAAGQEAEAVHRLELRPERVRDALLEPADHPGARAPEHVPCSHASRISCVDPVHAPDREHVRGVAAADADRVLREHELAQVGRRIREREQRARLGAAREAVVEHRRPRSPGRRRGRHVEHARPLFAGQLEHVAIEQVGLLGRVSAAAEADDVPLRRHRTASLRRTSSGRQSGRACPGFWLNRGMASPSQLKVGDRSYAIHRLDELQASYDIARLPYTLRVLLENVLRNGDEADVEAVARWNAKAEPSEEISFAPSRVLLQDLTGVPAVVDLAAMRNAMADLGGEPSKINPLIPAELVIDHSVQVDSFASRMAFGQNVELEYERNHERYLFLRWGQKAFSGFQVVPPGTGICHQVNLEYLARVVEDRDGAAFPDTLVGTDSHTTMVNGLGVLGWGVGGIEAEAAMLGQPLSMLVPQVVGFKLSGALPDGATATDLVLTVTEMLRKTGVVGKFVEYFGEGLDVAAARRPRDDREHVARVRRDVRLLPRRPGDARLPAADGTLARADRARRGVLQGEHALARPERARDVLARSSSSTSATSSRRSPARAGRRTACRSRARRRRSSRRSGRSASTCATARTTRRSPTPSRPPTRRPSSSPAARRSRSRTTRRSRPRPPPGHKRTPVAGADYELDHGSVVIAAITSCTNTSNPQVMVAAGLLARNAVERGLQRQPWVKSSLAPGSKVVTRYYEQAGLQEHLDTLGFNTVGYGCTTCIGNSGPLADEISAAIGEGDLVVCSVLSGNRNFEARIHPEVKANYLASPPLVVAYSLAGRMDIDWETEPIGTGSDGEDVFLRDIWPSAKEVSDTIATSVRAEHFSDTYADVFTGDELWRDLPVPEGELFAWAPESTYVRHPPYFEGMSREPGSVGDIEGARVLVWLGDSVTTDHISPAGSIRPDSPAGAYLVEHGVAAQGLQLLRCAARQPRGDGSRHVRERAAAQQARSRLGRDVDEAHPVGRGDDDLRRVTPLPRRGHADDRDRRQGVRLRLVARLGGEGPEPARRQGRDRRVVRAHPPLEPADDGRAAAAVHGRREPRDARPDRQ